jgi:thioesterase domain-containing protein
MAACYITAMQTVQLEGPYFLGGWSMGGLIAFEMAQQLHEQGQEVALLALLDARMPIPDEKFAEEDFEARLLVDVDRYFGLSLDPQESLARLPKDELLTRVLEQAKRASLIPQEIEISQAHRFIQLLKSDFRATQDYVLKRYPGRVTLFKASEELAGTSPDPTLGWNEWAAGGVEVHVVPGNHATMVYKPHVEVLAEKLRACLNQVQSTEATDHRWRQTTDQILKEAQLRQWVTDGGSSPPSC